MRLSPALLLLLLLAPGLPADQFRTLTVLYTGDLHAELYASPDWTVPGDPKPELGGLDRLKAALDRERNRGSCLTLDAGDFASGSPEVNKAAGLPMIDLYNRLGYDAVCVGERDIGFVTGLIDTIAQRAAFRLLGDRALSAHAVVDMPVVRPSLLREVNGLRVGLIGILDDRLAAPGLDTLSPSSGLDPAAILDRELRLLSSQDAQLVIVLAHMSLDRARRLARTIRSSGRRSPPVACLISAHDGWIAEDQDSLPFVLAAGRRGQRLGVCRIVFDTLQGAIAQARSRTLNIWPRIYEPDSALTRRTNDLRLAGFDDSVATSAWELLPGPDKASRLGPWLADNIRSRAGVAAVILPGSVLDCALLRGPVTRRELHRIAPYDEPLVVVRLSGAETDDLLKFAERDSWAAPLQSGIRGRPAGDPPSSVLTTRSLALNAGIPGNRRQPFPSSLAELLFDAFLTTPLPPRQPAESEPAPVPRTLDKVNINTADLQELQTLPGIGPKTAEKIVQHRQAYGPFRRLEDLLQVKGIGPGRFARIKDRIRI